MTDFVTADTHFGHTNIILHAKRPWCITNPNYDPRKPYNFKGNNPIGLTSDATENHDTALIESWNAIVGRKDRVFILGDFAWKNHSHYIMRLNGSKYLIRGNHDKMSLESLRSFKRIDCTHHYHFSYYVQIHKKRIMLSHCPYSTWFSSSHDSWNLHGHSHGRFHEQPYLLQFDVGVDIWGYRPIPWSVIERKMNDKEKIRKEYYAMSPKERLKNFELPPEGEESDNHTDIIKTKNKEYLKAEGIVYEN
jgi:calcineurin-like phosphoesterase family protein